MGTSNVRLPPSALLVIVALLSGACDDGKEQGSSPDRAQPVPAADPLAEGGAPGNPLAGGSAGAPAAVWMLEALGADELERVREHIGRRAGVRVAAVASGSPEARGGVLQGYILFAVDGAPVETPEAADAAVNGASETADLAILRAEEGGGWRIVRDRFIAGRWMGPVSRAESLLPAFSAILATMEISPPDEPADLMVGLAASVTGNAVISTGWSH